ncbi:MAG: DUF1775 domain-containing protein, partial [Actinobacteria bacterium]|nr:DUF1775 domain-containing protein [Actinomycetota bacterium]
LGGDAVSEVVSAVTWTADTPEDAIKPGEFDEFNISLGPLPSDVDTLTFKALQTYANGEVVRWIEAARTDDAEPERPAPVLMLTAPTELDAIPTQQETPAVTKSDLDDARTLGTVGIVVGALGLLTGITAVVAARRPRS